MVLEAILENKRAEVSARRRRTPLDSFRDSLAPSRRSLKAALTAPRTGFILECKKASPSRGLIRAGFDVAAIAETYSRYADAISVLADEVFFQGSLAFVKRVSETVKLPVLCKDFTIDPYQVFEARRFGADAVLLMLSVLDDDTYVACLEAARALALDVLTEVHDDAELERALALGAEIIGVNNRSFIDLAVDLDVSRRLAPRVPSDRVLVIESGISSHEDIVSLRELGNGFLVGSSLMGCPDLDAACRDLVYGPVKVCGLTRPEDAAAAHRAGARFGGLIFAGASPRCVAMETAEAVRRAAPLDWVGVFVDAPAVDVATIASRLGLKAVQLHGDETRAYIEGLRPVLPEGCEVWKAVPVGAERPILDSRGADRVLLDTASAAARGGTGKRFDWSLISGIRLDKVVLSGGLDPETAAAADRLGAGVLDVNSGVEDAPGIKSAAKLQQFFGRLRGEARTRR